VGELNATFSALPVDGFRNVFQRGDEVITVQAVWNGAARPS
jgi:hypothetical protein